MNRLAIGIAIANYVLGVLAVYILMLYSMPTWFILTTATLWCIYMITVWMAWLEIWEDE